MKDSQDGYSFVYPFGWQEVAVKGQDVVYKDVIEPLESVSVSITKTDKANVSEFGSPAEVRTMWRLITSHVHVSEGIKPPSCLCMA